jgi:hypothetical protein
MNNVSQLLDLTAQYEVVECHDPSHCHVTPFQIVCCGFRNGHYVEFTIDGNQFSARVDDDPCAKVDVSYEDARFYVEQKTEASIFEKVS